MKRLGSAGLGVIGLILASGAAAQEPAAEAQAPQQPVSVGERVAATVNDVPISTFDVRQRMRLIMITQGIEELPEEAIAQFQQEALRDLIEEQLKLQEAAEWELEIADEEIDEEIAKIAASGRSDVEGLARELASQGVDLSTLRRKIRADLAWERLVRGRYGSRVSVTEDEVENTLEDLRASVTEDQYLLSEICLPVGSPSEQEQMFGIGMQMIEQMRRGAPFRALAGQYSACPSAARGGDLGWLRASELDPDLATVVTQLEQGSISRPIPQQGMLKLVAVRQIRPAATAGEPGYSVAYAGMPATVDYETAEERLTRLPRANACNGDALSSDLGPDVGVTVLPMLKEQQFQTVFHDVLAGLEEGETSDVIKSEGAYHIVQLCEKDEGYGLPSKRVVESQLRSDELDLLSRRYLRDVERDAAVEIRLTQSQPENGS